MANLQYGDLVKLPKNNTLQIDGINDVVPIKFDTINEQWIVCEQNNATHMLIVANTHVCIKGVRTDYFIIEIGKCENIYLLADAIVD